MAQELSNPKDAGLLLPICEIIGIGLLGVLSSVFFSTEHKIAGIWFSFLAVASWLTILATRLSRKHSPRAVWGVCGTILVLVATWFSLWTVQLTSAESSDTQFAITVATAFKDKGEVPNGQMNGGGIWFFYPSSATAYPIHKAMFVHFRNLKGVALMIDAYSVEGKQSNGHWVKIPCVNTIRGGEILWEYSSESAGRFRFIPTFDEVVKDKNIRPGETIKGWIFLARSRIALKTEDLRFRFTDGSGKILTSRFSVPEAKTDLSDVDLRGATMLKISPIIMTTINRVFYEDR